MSIPQWDSVGHMTLMGALEDEFDIVLEMDDIIDFSSFKKGIDTPLLNTTSLLSRDARPSWF